MKNISRQGVSARRVQILFLLISCVVVSACTARDADLTWIEPVQLSAGETIKIKRHIVMIHERAWGGGFSSAPIYTTSSIELEPSSAKLPKWDAPLVPVVLDKDAANGEWVIVASIDGCSLWDRNGRPRPPYWAFRLRGGEWFRDAIPDSYFGRPANLLVEYDVGDESRQLEKQVEERKRSQLATPKHARLYRSIDQNYQKTCNREASDPVGHNELDLKKFRSIQ